MKNSAKGAEEKYRVAKEGWYYTIRELKQEGSEDHLSSGSYFPGRAAEILLTKPGSERVSVGTFGILHPEVLGNFDIQYPTSSLELDLEALLE